MIERQKIQIQLICIREEIMKQLFPLHPTKEEKSVPFSDP